MEGLMLEILISLCQTGAEIYGFALGLIGIGIGTVVGVAIVVAKAVSYTHLDVYKRQAFGTAAALV